MSLAKAAPTLPTCSPSPSVWDVPLSVHLARLVIIPLVLYVIFLASLTIPVVQRFMLFLHKAQWPLFAKFDNPEVYGFAPNRVRNLYLRTPDGARIGVWHILPESVIERLGATQQLSDKAFDDALKDPKHCVMTYMHGNAGNRVIGHRKHLARHVSSGLLDMNMIVFDYRGFGDSSNLAPSEEGLVIDARTVWNWLTEDKAVPASQIVLSGQSLGTGVACALAGRDLAAEGITPRALILTAPFTSIRELLLDYKLLEIVPILQPLRYVNPIRDYILGFLSTNFDSLSVIQNIRCPILLIHSINDGGIPIDHSRQLFRQLCSDPSRTGGVELMTDTLQIGKYAVLKELRDARDKLGVQYLEMHFGGHNDVGYSEVALQTMRKLIFDK
ncbi:alpha/beta-hydrolase [Cystobasidium minutum MCA 4210]|uniref:alpha/beta-hydrolase n=1 Tax=Cystobasidium minutum MCA 4210 TaxID=1397322 RepID=UPI0034CFE6A3|eukprot:jgi/Rhomi1/192050/gm1.264_g